MYYTVPDKTTPIRSSRMTAETDVRRPSSSFTGLYKSSSMTSIYSPQSARPIHNPSGLPALMPPQPNPSNYTPCPRVQYYHPNTPHQPNTHQTSTHCVVPITGIDPATARSGPQQPLSPKAQSKSPEETLADSYAQEKQTYLRRIYDLEGEAAKMNQDVTELQDDLQKRLGKLTDTEATAESRLAGLVELQKCLTEEANQKSTLQAENQTLQNELAKLKRRVTSLETELQAREREDQLESSLRKFREKQLIKQLTSFEI